MRKYKQKELLSEVLEDIICDICGKSCRGGSDLYEFSTFSASWGYGSRKDCDTWKCDICEECSDKIKLYIESLGGKLQIINDYDYLEIRRR